MGAVAVASFATGLCLAQVASAPHPSSFETVVTAPPAPDGASSVGAAGANDVAGAAGDLGRALENAPGVARMAPASGGLVLWGSTPEESRVLLDGVEIPALFHFGGWRTVVPSAALRDASVLPGAFAASFGRASGGIVDVHSADADAQAHHAQVQADLLDASAGASGPLGSQGNYLGAARFGYLNYLQSAVTSAESRALVPMPAYRDGLVKTTFDLDQGRRLTLEVFAASDRSQLALAPDSPTDALIYTNTRSFWRALAHFRQTDEAGTTDVLVFAGTDRAQLDEQLGLVPVALHSETVVMGTRIMHGLALSGQWLEIGLDGLVGVWSIAEHGSLTLPPREGDETIFGAPPDGATGSDNWHPVLGEIAPYALADLHWGRFALRPGVRVADALVSSDRTLPPTGLTPPVGFSRTIWTVEPRLAMGLAATPWLALDAAAGVHHQLPDATDLSPVFGSPSLGESRAEDAVLSAAMQRSGLALATAAFVRELTDLPARNPNPQPALAQELVSGGQGRSYGAQLAIRRDAAPTGLGGQLSYTLSRSLRRAPGESDWRLFDYDQTHVLAAVLGYRARRWFAGARLRYATGMPRTPVVGAYYDSSAGEYRPILGAQNSIRLPAFVELDLRAERSWQLRSLRLTMSLDVLDATDHENAEEIIYSGDYSHHAYVTGLPLLATLGLRLEI
jgi:hypothetical protein